MKTASTTHGYLALHAMMLHIWNQEEILKCGELTKDQHREISQDVAQSKRLIRQVFDIEPEEIVPDEDWEMANLPAPPKEFYWPYIQGLFSRYLKNVPEEYDDHGIHSPNK